MEEFISRILTYKIAFDIFDALIGVGICYGALKWRKGLITTVAFYWGLILGGVVGMALTSRNMSYYSSSVDTTPLFLCLIAGGIVFPILTYKVAGVNRFVLGFIVITKLAYMITTVGVEEYGMDISTALTLPLLAGTVAGLVFMAWTKIKILPFVITCAFMGASQTAPKLANFTQMIRYGSTGDSELLPGVEDIILGLFRIELTDEWTLIWLVPIMATGMYFQFRSVRMQGYTLDTPLITYETDNQEEHGMIHSSFR